MKPTRIRWLLCLALLSAVATAQEPPPLLAETFDNNAHGWLVDEFSKLSGGGYLIDARGNGGYYRWLAEPKDLVDFTAAVDVEKLRGNNAEPLFGLLFRLQDSWRNSYFFVINGSGGYVFGKFVQGSAVILKQGNTPALKPGGAKNVLSVTASGNTFGLAANGTPLANVVDDTFPGPGRIGLCVEAPAMVRFDNLMVTPLGDRGLPPAGDTLPPSGVRTLFEDTFETNTGWATDDFRQIENGVYRLSNQGERKSFLSWHPETNQLTDFVARIDARKVSGDPRALYGLCCRVRDGQHFYFFLVNPDGRYYAGVCDGAGPIVIRQGRQPAIRDGDAVNTLEVRADGRQMTFRVNGSDCCTFSDERLTKGAVGLYLEQPAVVEFDNLLVTETAAAAPPVVGATSGGRWPVGALLLAERLDRIMAYAWPTDEFHRFDKGGYCVSAPDEGSRTVTCEATRTIDNGVYMVTARADRGPVTSGFGLVVRANEDLDSFYFLTMNAAGTYYVGKCVDGDFSVLDSGPVGELRGGGAGNDLQLTVVGAELRYGINDRPLGTVRDATLGRGAAGLYVEHGVTAWFSNLRVYALPGG